MESKSSGERERQRGAITSHQVAAAVSPHRRTSDLLGNFGDFDCLFELLGEPVVIQLGTPLPKEKFLPKRRIGSCPAAHNEALLGERKRRSD